MLSAPHPLGEIAFERCRVPADAMLGAEGRGYGLGLAALDRLRPTVAAAACGMAARALAESLAHVKQREQFGKPLAQFQLVQQKLARMATDLAAARLLTYRAAFEKDQGQERITSEAAMAKSFATEMAQRVVDDAVQLIGGRGVLADHPVDRLYRAVRALRIYEGTTEIQQLIIAGELLKIVTRVIAAASAVMRVMVDLRQARCCARSGAATARHYADRGPRAGAQWSPACLRRRRAAGSFLGWHAPPRRLRACTSPSSRTAGPPAPRQRARHLLSAARDERRLAQAPPMPRASASSASIATSSAGLGST